MKNTGQPAAVSIWNHETEQADGGGELKSCSANENFREEQRLQEKEKQSTRTRVGCSLCSDDAS